MEKDGEAIDEWEDDFLQELIRFECEVIASKNPATTSVSSNPPNPNPNPNPNPPPPSYRDIVEISYSPPRELSQRVPEERNKKRASASSSSSHFGFVADECEIIGTCLPKNGGGGGGAVRVGNRKDKELDRLKRELSRISKQLTNVEHERKELQKDKEEKDEQLRCAYSQIKSKDAEIHVLKKANLEASKQDQLGASLQLHCENISSEHAGPCRTSEEGFNQGIPQALEWTRKDSNGNALTSKNGGFQADRKSAVSELKHRLKIDNSLTTANGITVQERYCPTKIAQSKGTGNLGDQTDAVKECGHTSLQNVLPVEPDIISKLRGIWGSPSDRMSGRNLVSKLFITCSSHLCVLFKYMNLPSMTSLKCQSDRNFSGMALHDGIPSGQSSDAVKVSRFYETLMKLRNELGSLQALVAATLDLCTLENVVVTHRSLCILHAILKDTDCITRLHERNNALVDQSVKRSFSEGRSIGHDKQIGAFGESEKAKAENESSMSNLRKFGLGNLFNGEERMLRTQTGISFENLMDIFKKMQEITFSDTEECIRVEALSVMNLILMWSDPNSEREKFWLTPLLESLPQLFRKEAGLHVRQRAVRLLFLLLNCTKVLVLFCGWQRDDVEHANMKDGQISTPALEGGINRILDGLAECLSCEETNTQDLKLRRDVIIMLAFIASSGKSGFDILLYSVIPQQTNFLELIVQVLASAMDADTANDAESQDFCKERISLMREALILLNRLASNPTYSRTTLGVLTSSTSARLTIDVANRIPRRIQSCWKHNGTRRTQIEVEIEDLARLFKARVFAFLGVKES